MRRRILLTSLVLLSAAGFRCGGSKAPREILLGNGLKVLLQPTDSPIVSAVYQVACGKIHGEPGLTFLTTHLLFRGSKVRTGPQIYEEIETRGGRFGTDTGLSISMIAIQAPAADFTDCYEIFCECLTMPSFDEEEVSRGLLDRGGPLTGLFSRERMPWWDDRVREKLFPESPLANFEMKKADDLNRERVIAHYARYFQPSNAVLSIVGRFDRDEIMMKTAAFFKAKASPVPEPLDIPLMKPEAQEDYLPWPMKGERIVMGFQAPASLTEPFFSALIAQALLDGGESGILTRALSQARPGVTPQCTYRHDPMTGYIVVGVNCQNDQGKRVRKIMEKVVGRIRMEGISVPEFEIARRKVLFGIAKRFQNSLDAAIYLGLAERQDSPCGTRPDLERKVRQLKLEEVESDLTLILSNPVTLHYRAKTPKN